MYLSRLRVEVGPDPAREYPGQLWLRNLYHVHQRLCMAFPSADRRSAGLDDNHVHVRRGPDAGFLFRIDPGRDGRPVILVQSALKPAWECAFYNARHFLVDPGPNPDPWEVKIFAPQFEAGQRFRFRLLANPTHRLSKHSLEADGKPVKQESIGKRVPVPADRILDWLIRHAETGGFSVASDSVTTQPGYIYVNKTRDGKGQRLRSVRFDGTLEVTDADKFCDTLVHGIGSGKGFGFGLLSVAPL